MFLSAELQFEGDTITHRVRVRNLSALGMMAEGEFRVLPGTRVKVTLRNVPSVEGSVAWVQGQRFGIAFAEEIDPRAPRSAVGNGDLASPRYVRPSTIAPPSFDTEPKHLRKI
ncbi:PilZ domain-containing protein [Tsuneonella dongtanensis]|uniref:PilZ domain-containing protein n=1 Tax=Tsuneonella dongtanensis TaxID=692370 RepID=UPI00300102BA